MLIVEGLSGYCACVVGWLGAATQERGDVLSVVVVCLCVLGCWLSVCWVVSTPRERGVVCCLLLVVSVLGLLVCLLCWD